jgi:hypothetical protein
VQVAFFDRFFALLRAFLGEPLDKSLRRRLRAAAPATIAELREGLHCRIAGSVRPLDQGSLEAPLSGLPCVAYLLEVVEHSVMRSNAGVERDLVVYDRKAVPFLLVDGEHRAVIDPAYAQILLVSDHELRASSPLELSPRARAVLAKYAPHRTDWDRTTKIWFRESIVEVGDRVSIAGVGRREADPHAGGERGYRDSIQERLHFVGSAKLPLLIGADPP